MLRGKWSLWVAVTAVTAVLAGGCCQEQDNKIASLTRENTDLKAQRTGLQTQLTAAQEAERDATSRLTAKDNELRDKDQTINGLLARLNQPATRPPTGAEGWEHGTFGDRVVVGSDVLFDSGKEVLKLGATAHLDKIVQDIKTHYPNMVIRVYGHTDTDKISKTRDKWDDNLDLSAARALTVTRYLTSKGISAKLIETVAMGEFHPEGADKSKNRRVEIYAVKAK